ncbi:seminal metalloprotease 1-like [Rhagoletis pomonella]|uniref:seminal metalloprotease 1-like n=1 Tax=Rhagoletis pomonella TaxID=28610 RepID=UPI0017811543|nr:seminal metalloprotease 1-like [Rhagoletis pomonella]
MKIISIFALLSVIGAGLAAPLSPPIEEDPELIAGYFEGDIVLSSSQRNGYRNETRRWPNNTVYYKFNEGVLDEAHRNHILRGIQILEEVSCIRFKEATDDQQYYVNITSYADGCYSSVGWLNRVQTYNLQTYALDSGCFRLGTIVHEFLHTLGFYHMQSASNRDEYVRIATENIRSGYESNFNKYDEDFVDDYDEEYDYGSVLHYTAYAFSANGEMTIVPLKDEAAGIMGQRRGLSQSDINKLNTMYRCPVTV